MNMNYPKNIKEIKKFAKRIKLDVKYLLGEKCDGLLFLDSVKSLPENIVFNVDGSLILNSVDSLPSNTIFNVKRKIRFSTKHKVKVIWS